MKTGPFSGVTRAKRRRVALAASLLALAGFLVSAATAALPTANDPRVGLTPGITNAGVASKGIELLANRPKPTGFVNPANFGDLGFANSDLAHQGNYTFVGNFRGFNIYDVSNPNAPVLTTSVLCPGGQGDVSVYENLLFMSTESTPGRIDCGTANPTAAQRLRGIRIFDISNIASPTQVAFVQTCRGSHTHTLVEAPDDPAHVYIYVSGTGAVRPTTEMVGCVNSNTNTTTPNTNEAASHWRIEVIKVPVANPTAAAVVNGPRLFRNPETGALNGLQNTFNGDGTTHPSGGAWGPTPNTNHCHDITVYEELDLAAGACSGNGLLIDISDPANPVRIDAVADPNYAYWHGATFTNDGKTVMFTDEWGGGTAARCRATDQLSWGANAIFDIVDRKLVFRSYYKLPVVQSNQENCVGHIPSLVPVPGRDLFIQAWYQGGASLVDLSDPANPVEIGFYDRGPNSGASLVAGGLWSTYWYNGVAYGSEIGRGLDVFGLTPIPGLLTQNEIDAAKEVTSGRFNAQTQQSYVNEPSFAVGRAYTDQLARQGSLERRLADRIHLAVDRLEDALGTSRERAARANLRGHANQLTNPKHAALRETLLVLAGPA
jgi:hypothetical protein